MKLVSFSANIICMTFVCVTTILEMFVVAFWISKFRRKISTGKSSCLSQLQTYFASIFKQKENKNVTLYSVLFSELRK